MVAIMTISGTMTALTSCNSSDDNAEAVMKAFPEMATLKEPTKEFADHLSTCALWMLSVTFGVW